MKYPGVALSLSVLLCGVAVGQIQFHPAVSYSVGEEPEGGALFDFDGDGDLDLAVSTEDPDKVEFLTNLGPGVFVPASTRTTGSGTSPEGLAPGDFDNDGDLDLVAALYGANQVRILLNQGNGTFALGAAGAVQVEPSVAVAADFDGDGFVDAAVNNRVSGTVSVLRNDQAGGLLAAVHYPVGAETRCVAAADLDADGHPDLAVSSRDDRRVRLLRNLGDGTFTTLIDLSLGAFLEPQGVAIEDFDVDGALDVITATSGTAPKQEHPSVFLQHHSGKPWVGPINGSVLPGISPTGIAAADFDLDGIPDAATSNADTENVSVMRSSGIAGIFYAGALILPIGEEPEFAMLLCGDVDSNGAPDLVAFNVGGDDVSVLRNKKNAPFCQADLGFGGPSNAVLSICGQPLASGGTANLLLSNAPANQPAWLVASTSFTPTPFSGGTLVPIPVQLLVPVFTDAGGHFALPGIQGGAGPLAVYLQCAIADPGQPLGYAISNAVRVQLLP